MAGRIRKIKNWLQFPKPFLLCLSFGDKIAFATITALNDFLRIVSEKSPLQTTKILHFCRLFGGRCGLALCGSFCI